MKRLFYLLLAICCVTSIYAQDEDRKGKAKVAFDFQYRNLPVDSKYMSNGNGVIIGIGTRYFVSNDFSLSATVGYAYDSYGTPYKYKKDFPTMSLNYISLPLHADYAITGNFSIFAGPRFEFPLSGKMELGGKKIKMDNLKSSVNYLDFGLRIWELVSVSYSISLDNKKDRFSTGMISIGLAL